MGKDKLSCSSEWLIAGDVHYYYSTAETDIIIIKTSTERVGVPIAPDFGAQRLSTCEDSEPASLRQGRWTHISVIATQIWLTHRTHATPVIARRR